MVILVETRRESAPEVQKVLTGFGCIIRMRLGMHPDVLDSCSNEGLIILELVGKPKEIQSLEDKLNAIDGVATKVINISLQGKKRKTK
jgi:hypothetical protein